MPANYVLLERIELNASAASVTFSNIPQTGYTDLKVDFSIRTDKSAVNENVFLSFNGSTANFSARWVYGDGSGVGNSTSGRIGGFGNGNTATANTFGSSSIYIPNYTASTNKSYSSDAVLETNATTAYAGLIAGLWSNTAAITSITLTPETGPNFLANSTFSLYGLAALGTTPTIAPKAAGGNIITDGTYWYHTFLSSGTFTPQVGLSCDVLVVAGGGGGGTNTGGGGGGAGGLLAFTSQALTATNYAVTVGAGGAGGTSLDGTNGADSQFGALTLVKGGGGGGGANQTSPRAGVTGGSGGGGSSGNTGNNPASGGSGTSGQGNAGGASTNSSGGGGGGAGAVGASGATGLGGNGLNTYSSWATATGTGASGYYAGGGGGSWYPGGSGRSGGLGGGGTGGNYQGNTQTAGLVNTGGGGGAGGGTSTINAQPGGSGIVIVRYAI